MQKISNCEHIFFDLDHTLWDFERNSTETLQEMYQEFDIGVLTNASDEEFLEAFSNANAELWGLYNYSKVTKEDIRDKRFPMAFERLGGDPSDFPKNLGQLYLDRCPTKPHLMPYTFEILDYLQDQQKYKLHILTNGFSDTQAVKLERSGIAKYFESVVTSESTGHKKPDRRIFDYAINLAKAELPNSVMIGDNLLTDIAGAREIGMKNIFYNYGKVEHFHQVDYEITHLEELKKLF